MLPKIRLAILEDHQSIVDGYMLRLGRTPQIEIVGVASSGAELEELLRRTAVDIVFLDVNAPTDSDNPSPYPILHVIPSLKQKYPDLSILIISMIAERALINGVMSAGASGYILKDDSASIKELGSIVLAVAEGEIYLSRRAQQEILKRKSEDLPDLTPRQLEALSIAAAYPEFSRNELAAKMCITSSTVRNLLSQVYFRLGVTNLAAAVAKARQLGLITPPSPSVH